jgi:hypothetical protein
MKGGWTMSSYYPSFSYTAPNGKRYNSHKDKHLIVTHFESGDSGEVDTFLEMEPIYTDNAYGTRRIDYGAKYTSVAVIRISVMKDNGKDFTVSEVRDFLRWTTGSRAISYLDLSDIVDNEEVVRASFLGRITAAYQQKLDARTIGLVIEHTSVSPYAYSPIQYVNCSFGQELFTDNQGVLYKDGQSLFMDTNGILSNGSNALFSIDRDGTVFLDNSVHLPILNDTDDLSDYVYLDAVFNNINSDHVVIKNQTLYNESNGNDGITEITGMHKNEVIKLSSGQFITSSSNRTFGNNFNFIWPKLLPGDNTFVISGTGEGVIEFMYRTPMKIGDCAIDIDVSDGGLCCGGSSNDSASGSGTTSGPVTWDDILGKPNTIKGYGITDAYTISEVDNKLSGVDISIDATELNEMLEDVLK